MYPTIPEDWLHCADEQPVGDEGTDVALAKLAGAWRDEGADCRSKLGKLSEFVHGWPKPEK